MTSGRARALATSPSGASGATLSTGLLPALLGYHLRRAQTAVFKHFAQAVGAEEDLTPGLFGMLQLIAANPGLCQSRLAEAMGVDRSTIVSVLHRLEARGLVERRPSPEDRRSHALRLSQTGARVVEELVARVRRHEERIAAALSPRDRARLIELLKKIS